MKQYTLINRVLAGIAFLITLITYTVTLQPSVPFWDCGEFSAATAWQQVPHPPGAPLFLITARWFHMLPFGDPGWRINMFSAASSAFTAALVYLIIVALIERWRPYREGRPITSYLATFGAGLIGTLAFTWSDTQWFNSVESEVYAAGTTLIALMMWLMMRWDANAERRGHERYLLGIAYLTGLAFGVHLLALLVVPGVAMVIYFRRYQFQMKTFLIMLVLTAVVFLVFIYKAPLTYIPNLFAVSPVAGLIVIGALVGALWWAVRERNSLVYLSSAAMLLIILGFSTYTHILLRANSHPPMNENEPDTVAELVSYLGREQYGNRGAWPRRQETEAYYRRYQDQYGEWYPPVDRNPDGTYKYDRINTGGELNFMFKYQIGDMYLRYLLWNFVGRVSDIQDAPWAGFSVPPDIRQRFITPTGYDDVFPIQFYALPFLLGLIGLYYHFRRDWKMALVYSALFLLLGLLATLQQNQQKPQPRERDYFYTGSFMIFAMWIGIGAAGLAEQFSRKNEEETDEEGTQAEEGKVGVVAAVMAIGLLVAPVNMVIGGWKAHNRSGNWVPWDYAYNILQSCEKDAILFCNGDNDTFPLWYMQDVAGVRRDVRVVNLSLGQTAWYIWQLKNERPWGAKQVPISFPNQMLEVPEGERGGLVPELAESLPTVTVDVPANVMAWATDGTNNGAGKMTWTMRGGDYGDRQGSFMGVQHKLVRNIIETNKWERPIYFSTSTQADVWCGLEPFFRAEGMAYRIMPVQQAEGERWPKVNMDVMRKCLLGTLAPDDYSETPRYGFKFRNLTNPDNFFMEDHRRLMINYRLLYISLATAELEQKNAQGAIAALDKLETQISPDMFAMPYQFSAEIATRYREAGANDKAAKYAQRAIAAIDALGELGDPYGGNPLQVKAQMYAVMGDYDRAMQIYETLGQQTPGNPNVRAQIENLRLEKFLSKKDTAGAVAELQKIIAGYGSDSGAAMHPNVTAFRMRLAELSGNTQDNTRADDSSRAQSGHVGEAGTTKEK